MCHWPPSHEQVVSCKRRVSTHSNERSTKCGLFLTIYRSGEGRLDPPTGVPTRRKLHRTTCRMFSVRLVQAFNRSDVKEK